MKLNFGNFRDEEISEFVIIVSTVTLSFLVGWYINSSRGFEISSLMLFWLVNLFVWLFVKTRSRYDNYLKSLK